MHRFSYVHNVHTSPLQYRTLPDCLKQKADDNPDDEAFVILYEDSGRTSITWRQLYQRSTEFAKGLLSLGANEKDVVAISGPNCPEWLYASFGTMMARAIPTTIAFKYSDGSDVVGLLQKLESCSTFILHPGFENKQWKILKSLLERIGENGNVTCKRVPSLKHLVFMTQPTNEGDRMFPLVSEMVEGQHHDLELPRIDPEDIAFILTTSGSTGVPKLLAHTHFSLSRVSMTGTKNENFKMYNDRSFGWMGGFPYNVCTGETRVTPCFVSETTNYMDFMIKSIQTERCSWTSCFPTMLKELMDRKNTLPDNWPLKTITLGGQPISALFTSAVGTVCNNLFILYASSESLTISGKVVSSSEEYQSCSAGFVMEGVEVKVIDEKGHTVSIGTRGEIYVRSSNVLLNYFNDPEKTRKTKTDSGWYKTDDVGYLTDTGELFVEGRKSDMIICGGLHVIPFVMESLLKTFPGVDDVAVIPLSDPFLFQVVCAFIVSKVGFELTEEDMHTFCNEKYADNGRYTVLPAHYIFLHEFPRTYTGKIDKRSLELEAKRRFGVNSC